jgi:hypothetical protein
MASTWLSISLVVFIAAQPPAPPTGDKSVGVFDLRVSATPSAVEVEEPLILTVEILGNGPTGRAPSRIRLQGIPEFDRHFYIEDLPDPTITAEPNRWTFRYRLRPKNLESRRIPAIAFGYVHPNGQEQTAYSEALTLDVRPRSEKVTVFGKSPDELPAAVRQLATGEGLLQRDAAPEPPNWWVYVALACVPPAGCWLWYAGWQRRYPDASRRARMRRSHGAGKTLRALHRLRRDGTAAEHAAEVAAVVTCYLTDRLHLAVAGLTPREASLCLVRADVPAETVARVAEFFRACDSLRFAPPELRHGRRLAEDAEQIVAALESETCFARRR